LRPRDPSYVLVGRADAIGTAKKVETLMKAILGGVALSLAIGLTAIPADAKGCIKGAIIGGVAGHMAHHHGLIGAAAGCVIGHHQAKLRERAERAHAQEPGHGPGQVPGQAPSY
jgi:hypothetical protein